MLDARRPVGRLFFLLVSVLVLGMQADSGPAKTTITDVVYRADGTPASGVILVSWPTFTTMDGKAVAAGTKSVTLGPGGALSVSLVPNSGASPAGTYYTAVYQLDDGVKTEFWMVPANSPTTLAAVRTVLGQSGSAGQMATRQYVDAAVAAKASDSGVVHIAGSETIAGPKQFSAAPSVPAPVQPTDAVNKAYVDGAVANVGAGSYVSKAGDAMTGPLTLSGDPAAPNQASNRHYVDTSMAAKANLVNGVVPTSQLGNGAADGTLCLKGDSSWGACGGSSNATSIQNVPVDTSTPSDNQVITYDAASAKYKPKPGGGVTAGMQAVKYATDFSWTQAPSTDLSSPGPKTLSLAGCGPGVTGSEPEYYVYVSGTGTAEAVKVTGGTCKGDGTPGTLQFVTAYGHPAGYNMSSASGGLQEALIAARITPTNPPGTAQAGKVIVPPGELKAYARISIRASGITVDFSGSIIECYMTDTCIFVGDGYTMRFYLSQTPFTRSSRVILDEEYLGVALDPTRWSVTDPAKMVVVSGGKLQVVGATGNQGKTTILYSEKIELGGAIVLQHGNTTLGSGSNGILGGLYPGDISTAGCLAGFQVSPSGSMQKIQAVVSGALTGPVVDCVANHRCVLSTRLYSPEVYRKQQTFHSAAHPAGRGRGGAAVDADVRIVLELHDIDPANPGSMVAPSTVLYDGVIANAPGFCSYALVDATSMNCAIAFTRLTQAVDAEVRSALPGQNYRTRLVGPLSDGAECSISKDPALQFFSQYVPAPNELIAVHYRGSARALARITDPASIATKQRGNDDGLRGAVREVQTPAPRTAVDCENAALALLDDVGSPAWSGDYETWSDFLPGNAQDIFPGDAIGVSAPSRGAVAQTIVREVQIDVKDLAGEHSRYKIHLANDVAEPLGFEFQPGRVTDLSKVVCATIDSVGMTFLPDLTGAEITDVSSTTVTIDVGLPPAPGCGVEVRRSDLAWGPDNDRNLVGRFNTETFTVPRLSRVQDYFLRQYDASTPVKYSRYSVALHVDFPL